MATISLNDSAPKADGVHFSFAGEDFDLKGSGTYDTDTAVVVTAATEHPWLDVKLDLPADEHPGELDQNDPQNNPTIDPLSDLASPETLAAAEAERKRVHDALGLGVQDYAPVEKPAEPAPVAPVVEPVNPEVSA